MYSGVLKEVQVVKKRGYMVTTSKKIRDIKGEEQLKELIELAKEKNRGNIDYILWSDGKDQGIVFKGKDASTYVGSSCKGETVKNIFISELCEEEVENLTLIRKKGKYKASFKVKENYGIQSYIYDACDLNDLKNFLDLFYKEAYNCNVGAAFVSYLGKKNIKTFEKSKRNKQKVYRNPKMY